MTEVFTLDDIVSAADLREGAQVLQALERRLGGDHTKVLYLVSSALVDAGLKGKAPDFSVSNLLALNDRESDLGRFIEEKE